MVVGHIMTMTVMKIIDQVKVASTQLDAMTSNVSQTIVQIVATVEPMSKIVEVVDVVVTQMMRTTLGNSQGASSLQSYGIQTKQKGYK